MRRRIRDTHREPVKEERDAALGAPKSALEARRGIVIGTHERNVTTSSGPAMFASRRARRAFSAPSRRSIKGELAALLGAGRSKDAVCRVPGGWSHAGELGDW
jgi:hypothetical protein